MVSKLKEEGNKSKNKNSIYSIAIRLAIMSLVICGLLYPVFLTGVSQTIFPYQANGSLARLHGQPVGSYLIDDGFTSPMFFQTRNESNPLNASASGVDPDITIPQAISQIPGINNATGISTSALTQIVDQNEQGVYWIFGSPFVDVLQLNLALINQYPSVYSNFTAAQPAPNS
jgi:potassium-transporting ATPase KdpC subunit